MSTIFQRFILIALFFLAGIPLFTHAQVSDAPTLTSVVARDSGAQVVWTAPKVQGGSAITGYQIGYYTVGSDPTIINTGNVLTYFVSGLAESTTYRFFVRAVNSAGSSANSNELGLTTGSSVSVPGAPSTPSLTRGDGTISISWTAPSNNGGAAITSYIVSYRIGAGAEQTASVNGNTTSHQLTGLTGGNTYTIKVRAVNSAGQGSYSNTASITAAEEPGVPAGLEVTPGDGTLALSWTASSANGAAVSNYTVWYRNEADEEVVEVETGNTGTTYTITGLSNGQNYTVKVKSENEIGESSYSTEKLVAPDVNAEPVLVGTPNVIPTSSSATITWSTNKTMSSSIDYGLISTAVSTTEYNTVSRVVEHTVTLSNLLPCTSYSYKVNSKDNLNETVSSTQKTFTTTGCPVNAEVLSVERDSVVVADGGVLDFTHTNVKARFDIPSEVTCVCSVMTVQAKQLDKATVQTSLESPNNKNWLGDHVYNFTAYKDEDEVIEQFDLPVDVSIEYTREDIEGIDVDSLGIYHYDDDTEEWSTLTGCSNTYDPGTGTGTITCQTSSFSTFVLTSLEEDEMKKPTLRERLQKFFSRTFRPMSFKKFSRCGIENPE